MKRKKIKFVLIITLLIISYSSYGQTVISVYLDSVNSPVESAYKPGVFFVPKTNNALTDFLNNTIHQNSIRLNVIESALNNTSNLNDCIAYLDNTSAILQDLADKTDKLIFIFEKMPAWLSSSTDNSTASIPGWYVFNTKPPADWSQWNNVVATITNKIVNVYGITNAYFEIWNEPDLGSWTGTKNEYFNLFKNTYDAIKSVNQAIPVGGPATNYWGNNINFVSPYGYLNNQLANSSLIGQLIDSTFVWNKPLDFISWHNFNICYQTYQNATQYIYQKYTNLGLNTPELIVSEWNTNSTFRDTPIQKAFFIKNQIEMAKTSINNNIIAAWQDFNQSTVEFHGDYGLLTYGGIHKPAYNALLLSNKLTGTIIKNTSNTPTDIITSISNDTLNILITNYVPPAFIEAFNHTLFQGHFNANQIDSMGYIDINNNNISHLDSIYKGLIIIPNSNPINIAINNSIPIYSYYDSLASNNRNITINVNNLSGTHSGIAFKIDSTHNNFQFKYDSLLLQGYSQQQAISNILNNQSLTSDSVNLNNGQIVFLMQPNSIQFFQFIIPEITSINDFSKETDIFIYPNPTRDVMRINSEHQIGKVIITDISGRVVKIANINNNNITFDFSGYSPGIYLINLVRMNKNFKIVKE